MNREFKFDKMTSALYAKVVIGEGLIWSARMDWEKFKKEVDRHFKLLEDQEKEDK